MPKITGVLLAFILIFSFSATVLSETGADKAVSEMDINTVCGAFQLHRQDGKTVDISLEIAASRQKTAQGLMFREYLAPEGGMLFIFRPARHVQMWMKNTLISLDILFLSMEGRIIHIHENAIPHDLTPLPSGGVIGYAIEMRGGTAERLGLSAGDYVSGFKGLLTF